MNEIITSSRSAVNTWQACNRKRYLNYEAPNGTSTPGWEKRKVAIAPFVGIHIHRGLEQVVRGASVGEAAALASGGFLAEARARGLDTEVGCDEAEALGELSALCEAFVHAWHRVRWPRWQEEFETVAIEQEDRVALADDVVLAVRADWIVKRRADARMFVVNFKTVNVADDRWYKKWEIDAQLMTELLAAEQRFGQEFGGVIIEGLVKGRRQKEEDSEGNVTGYRETSRLIYGYKCEADPPLQPTTLYDWNYTRKKGWRRFPVWKEMALNAQAPVSYWVNWLPEEVIEQSFAIVPPIMRNAEAIEHKTRQIVEIERNIRRGVESLGKTRERVGESTLITLDEAFPQNESSCLWPSKCQFFAHCHDNIRLEDGLWVPRVDHHGPVAESGE